MVATTLSAGDVAIIGYNTGQSLSTPNTEDKLYFVLMKPIGSGTQIFFTDRSWNGTTFAAAGGDGTFTYTAGTDLPAGTVITITQAQLTAAGIDISHTGGDTFYVYQGAINTPTNFLYAAELADGNSTFNGSLVNTGLSTAASTAIAIQYDSGAYAGPTTHAGSFLFNGAASTLLASIADQTNWTGDDVDGVNAKEQFVQTGPWFVHHDVDFYGVGNPGGSGIFNVTSDSTFSSGIDTFNYSLIYNNALVGGVTPLLFHPNDIVFDTVNGKYFIADSDITGGHNRILQGNIADLLANPGTVPTLTVLYNDPGMTTDSRIDNLFVDTANQIVYFTDGTTLVKVNYNTSNQAGTVLFDADVAGNPAGSTNNFFTDIEIDFADGNIYLLSARATISLGGDNPSKNYIYHLSGLTSGSGAGAFSFAGGTAAILPFNPDDNDTGPSPAPGEAFPEEDGLLAGIALDPVNNILYFSTGSLLFDHDANSGTPPLLTKGGIFSYALTGNPNGNYTQIYEPIDDGNDGSDAISEANGPQGLLDDIEISLVNGRWYVVDFTGDTNGGVQNDGDEGIWSGFLAGGGINFIADINTPDDYALQGFAINHAPTLTGSVVGSPAVTEASSAPASGETAKPLLFNTVTIADPDTTTADEITGAVVRISNNFQSGATHQDFLRINNLTSGVIAGSGINFTYNSSTGAMVLTGAATVAEYKAAIELVTFSTSGDDITAYGAATTRQVAVSVSDGLTMSDEIFATITVTGINDTPVNNGMTGTFSGASFAEDSAGANVTGITITDVDANPATQNLVMTFSVAHGTLTFLTNVTGGIVAGDITGGANGSNTITITATQNEINATLAAAGGLVYVPTGNFNGNDTLTVVTNDQGFNGNDPGNSGTGTTEEDTDNKTIFVSAVNDAPEVVGDNTEQAADIFEDIPSAAGQTVSSLFGGQFSDATDDQTAFGGSAANTLAGIAVVANDSGATGQWQYFNGSSWVDIGPASAASAQLINAATAIRFNPAANFNGPAATLTVHLVDSSGAAFANGDDVDLSGGAATGGTTRYSTETVVLSQTVLSVNDAPTQTNLFGNAAVWTEGDTTVLLDVGANATLADVDSADFDTGTLTVAITGGLVGTEDQLGVQSDGQVTVGAGTITVGGNVIATFTGGGAGGGDLVFTLNSFATPATVAELLQAITFTNTGGEDPTDGDRTITWTLVDGDGIANGGVDTLSGTSTVDVDPVNDPPVVPDAVDANTSEQTAVTVIPGVSVSDPELDLRNSGNGDYDGASFFIGRATPDPDDFFSFDTSGASFTVNGGNLEQGGQVFASFLNLGGGFAVLFDSSNVTVTTALVNEVIQRLQYTNNSDNPPATVQLIYGIDDGEAANNIDTGTVDVNITPLNDAPDVDLDPPDPSITRDYTENGQIAVAPDANVVDPDSADFNTGVLTVQFTANGTADDRLTIFNAGTGAGQIGVSGSDVTYEGTTIGSFTGGTDGSTPLVVTLNANATETSVEALVVSIQYHNVSDNPSTLARTVSFDLTDGDGGTSNTPLATINVTAVNDPPTGAVNSDSVAEDEVLTFTASDFSTGMTDPESDGFAGVRITTLPATGTIELNGVAISAGDDITLAQLNAGDLTFTPGAGTASTSPTFTFQVRDDGGTDNGGDDLDPNPVTFTLNITVPDVDPVAQDDEVSTNEGVVLVGNVFADNGNGLDSDPDGPTLQVAEVNGNAGDVGNDITLPAGTALDLESDGSFEWGDNGLFDYLITAADAAATGAVNDTATDSFTYGLVGGTSSATVTVTINGVASAGDELRGDSADNTITDVDAVGIDFFRLDQGGDDTANGEGGNDVFDFGDEFDDLDTVDGGAGNDELRLAGDYFTNFVILAATTLTSVELITLANGFSYDLTSDDANVAAGELLTVDGSALAPTEEVWFDGSAETDGRFLLIGGGCDDWLIGGAGNDTFIGNTGLNLLEGGAGTDTVDYSAATGPVDVDLLNEFAADNGYGQSDGLFELENVIGTGFNDLIVGNDQANRLEGRAGADDLDGGDGNDLLIGGAADDDMTGGLGNDTFRVDQAGDEVFENGGEGDDTVITSVTYTLAAGVSVETLATVNAASTDAINLFGNEFGQSIYGNAGNNFLFGAGGSDLLVGLAGNDTLFGRGGANVVRGGLGDDVYRVDNAGDQVIENSGEGNDRVSASVSYVLTAGAHVETLSTVEAAATTAINLGGNELNQSVYGNAGNNILNGGGGNDALFGLGGNDLLIGGTGADAMTGGLGNDNYRVDDAGDHIVENAGEGNDSVAVSTSYNLNGGARVETLGTLNAAGTDAIDLGGNEFNNSIFGNAGNNQLSGGLGSDNLVGLAGDDTLIGGAGSDNLNGGAGADNYQFDAGLGPTNIDNIIGFNIVDDTILLDDAIFTALAPGALSASAFHTGSAASNPNHRIIYDDVTGALYYDADGSGGGPAVQFGRLEPGLALTENQFMVI